MTRVNVAIFLTAIGLIGVAPILLVGMYVVRRRSEHGRARERSRSSIWILSALATVVVLVGGAVAWAFSGPGASPSAGATPTVGMDGMAGMDGAAGDALAMETGPTPIPMEIAGQTMTAYVDGPEAIADVVRLHGSNFTVTDAQIATYGDGLVTVWRSGTPDPAMAAAQIEDMRKAIGAGTSPFEIPQLVPAEDAVYATSGMGQDHYFFAKGASVWWVAAAPALAERALSDALAVPT